MLLLEGRVYRTGSLKREALGIEDGKIAAIGPDLMGDEGHRDFGHRLILPGAIDVHVHFREPGMTRKEDFNSGTEAAAFGGVTTVMDMPNTKPPTVDARSFAQKHGMATPKANVDFGLYVGLLPGANPKGLEALAAAFKVYMAETTGDLQAGEPDLLRDLVDPARRSGKVVAFHAEDRALIARGRATDLRDHLRHRPNGAEAAAIKGLRGLGLPRGHVAHVSSREGLAALAGSGLTTEVTPHHLLLDASSDLGALGKVNPPLRTRADREALMDALRVGDIPMLASDHAPHTLEEKEDFEGAPAGMPGVETMVPLLLGLVQRGALPLSRAVDAWSTQPARIFGLPSKGALEVGRDADLLVVNPKAQRKIRADDLHSRCGWTAFEGWEAIFPEVVVLRGQVIVEQGELEAPVQGRFVSTAAEAQARE